MKASYDTLGDRMKRYEDVSRNYLMPRSYTLIRVDGRSFSQYSKNLNKPFDYNLIDDLNATWAFICANIQNAKLGYAQSDEFSLLLTDFDDIGTQQFFGGNIQKICSVVASMTAAKFNQERILRYITETNAVLSSYHFERPELQLAAFDCRAFNLPNASEAYNNFYWRWKDAERNSISSVAQAHFPHKELQNKNCGQLQEMLMTEKGINWSKIEESLKNGRFFVRKTETVPNPHIVVGQPAFVERTRWAIEPGWKLSEDPQRLKDLIPA